MAMNGGGSKYIEQIIRATVHTVAALPLWVWAASPPLSDSVGLPSSTEWKIHSGVGLSTSLKWSVWASGPPLSASGNSETL